MSLTRIGAVSTATVAVVVPSDVVSVKVVSFFLLHAASAANRSSALAKAPTRVIVRVIGFISSLGVGNRELQTGMDEIRVRNLVAVGGVNFFPFAWIAVELLSDLAQVVASSDDVGLPSGRGSRRATGCHV